MKRFSFLILITAFGLAQAQERSLERQMEQAARFRNPSPKPYVDQVMEQVKKSERSSSKDPLQASANPQKNERL